jgi:hypothetical protein
MSEDPMQFIAGDSNLNRYVKNSPTQYVDPSGLFLWTIELLNGIPINISAPGFPIVEGTNCLAEMAQMTKDFAQLEDVSSALETGALNGESGLFSSAEIEMTASEFTEEAITELTTGAATETAADIATNFVSTAVSVGVLVTGTNILETEIILMGEAWLEEEDGKMEYVTTKGPPTVLNSSTSLVQYEKSVANNSPAGYLYYFLVNLGF